MYNQVIMNKNIVVIHYAGLVNEKVRNKKITNFLPNSDYHV